MQDTFKYIWRTTLAAALTLSTLLVTLGITQITASAQQSFSTKQQQLNWEKIHETSIPNQPTAAAPNVVQQPSSPATTFNANPATLGAIPDGTGSAAQTPGAPLNVTFTVTGLTGNVQTIGVNMTFNPAHTFGGDVVATLIAPNGTAMLDIFGYTGATTATAFGDSSDLAGPYTFSDAATGDWWAAATAATSTQPIAAGSYRTSQRGGAGATGAQTSLNAVFAGLTAAQANGTWTLRFTDGGNGDTGSVSAASLDIAAGSSSATAHTAFDFDGDQKADITVFRPSTGAWYRINSATNTVTSVQFGQNGDIPVAADYDGDGKTDLAVFRPSNGVWYRLNSSTGAFVAVQFGQSGDVPTTADYDGDGKADLAVFRPATGVWYRLNSSDNQVRAVQFGQNGDIAIPNGF